MTQEVNQPNDSLVEIANRQIRSLVGQQAAALNLHKSSKGTGTRKCIECGKPYPCNTRRLLLGRSIGA